MIVKSPQRWWEEDGIDNDDDDNDDNDNDNDNDDDERKNQDLAKYRRL